LQLYEGYGNHQEPRLTLQNHLTFSFTSDNEDDKKEMNAIRRIERGRERKERGGTHNLPQTAEIATKKKFLEN
jgi:hypothetical protein